MDGFEQLHNLLEPNGQKKSGCEQIVTGNGLRERLVKTLRDAAKAFKSLQIPCNDDISK
jgi:hypothetical protein